jgi:PadR family transcriptional regulator AphA
MTWALPEWTVLALVGERPRHGFAVCALTGPDGEVGRVWQLPKPIVYRALGRLAGGGLVVPVAQETGPGPQRTVYAVTAAGRVVLDEWMARPVEHVRDIRSHLLMKLVLLDRAGGDPGALLHAQRVALEPIVRAVAAERDLCDGFDGVLATWRYRAASAALLFLDDIGARASTS